MFESIVLELLLSADVSPLEHEPVTHCDGVMTPLNTTSLLVSIVQALSVRLRGVAWRGVCHYSPKISRQSSPMTFAAKRTGWMV